MRSKWLLVVTVGLSLLLSGMASGCGDASVDEPTLLWKYDIPWISNVRNDGHVVLLTIETELHALDIETGKVLWRRAMHPWYVERRCQDALS